MFFPKFFAPLALALAGASVVQGGPIAYAICQTGAFISAVVYISLIADGDIFSRL